MAHLIGGDLAFSEPWVPQCRDTHLKSHNTEVEVKQENQKFKVVPGYIQVKFEANMDLKKIF